MALETGIAGKRALVTGSTAGIGYGIAKGLAAEGVAVTITGRTAERVEASVARLRAAVPGVEIAGVAADCGTAAGAAAVFAACGPVDILVNNLGIYERKPFFETPDEDWLRFYEVNVLSGVRFARHYAPDMVRKGWGRILFVSSESGLNIPKEMIHYGMSKTAQLAISRGLAIELAGTGVTVNSLLPGPTRTENSERLRVERAKVAGVSVAELEADFFKSFRPTSLTRKFHSVEEVASLAVYACSALAAATSGACLRADGGVVNQIM